MMSKAVTTNKSNRIFYYDALRALAIIGIVCCHMTAFFITKIKFFSIENTDFIFLLFFNSLRQFSIPIFVMISGALLINKDYTLSTFIRKKFNRIFVPYIFWAIILILFSFLLIHLGIKANIINSFSFEYIITSIIGLNKGFTKGRIFWFIWMILTVYIIIFILNKLLLYLDENKKNKIINVLVIIFVIYCLIFVPSGIIKLSPFTNTFNYYISFTGYALLGYFLAKRDFTKYNKYLKNNAKNMAIIFAIGFISSYVYYLIKIINLSSISNNLESISYFGILTIILSSSLFLLFRYMEETNKDNGKSILMKIKNSKLNIFINSLSKCSFGIYFIHPLVFIFYSEIFLGSMNILEHNPIKSSLLLIVLVLLTSWFIIWVLGKIPYVKKVSGV